MNKGEVRIQIARKRLMTRKLLAVVQCEGQDLVRMCPKTLHQGPLVPLADHCIPLPVSKAGAFIYRLRAIFYRALVGYPAPAVTATIRFRRFF